MKVEKIADIIYKELDYMYCDNCRFASEIKEEDTDCWGCEDCHRKYNGWGVSKATAGIIANKILKQILKEKQEQKKVFERIIERLEERTDFLKNCTKYGNKDIKQMRESYSTMMMYEVSSLVEDMIDIVKEEGGLNGN